ncbi:MAG: fumarate hydratase [Candidatus Methanomethylicaceae archaeon]
MKTLKVFEAYDRLRDLAGKFYLESLIYAPRDVVSALSVAHAEEEGLAREVMDIVMHNLEVARTKRVLICQDTGLPVYYLRIGAGLALNLWQALEAIREGVADVTQRESLRSSVCHPLTRYNPQTNTGLGIPVVHIEPLEDGEYLEVHLQPKGSGSENQTFFAMLDPAQGVRGVKQFVMESILRAGAKGCPPYIVGVGIGGSSDLCMWLAKKALFRQVGESHSDPEIAALEQEILENINSLGIGPQGLGGQFTALAVHIEYAYTHISQNPVAVNLQCWRGLRKGFRLYWDGRMEVLG